MKKFLAILLSAIMVLSTVSALAAEKIIIGVTPMPHAMILEFIQDDFEALGYELEIEEYTDYYFFNPATAAGDMNANYFQHSPFLDSYNADSSEDQQLVAAFGVHYEPMGLYAGQKKSLEDIADGDTVAVPNDASNQTRALLLLQQAGWITLPEDSFMTGATPEDIIENKFNLNIDPMNADFIPQSIEDVSYAIINGNHAIAAGFDSAADALLREDAESDATKVYTNVLAVRPADKDAQWVKDLQSVLLTDKVREYIETEPEFSGAVVPSF